MLNIKLNKYALYYWITKFEGIVGRRKLKLLFINTVHFISAVQHERGPRNSTIRRQVAMYLKETNEMSAAARVPVHFRSPYFGGILGMNEGITHCAAEPAKLQLGVLCQPTPKVCNTRSFLSTRVPYINMFFIISNCKGQHNYMNTFLFRVW